MSHTDLHKVKSLERKLYLRAALIVLAGVIMISAVWKSTNPWLSGVLGFGGFILIYIGLQLASVWAETFTKVKGEIRAEETGVPYKETYINWPPWFKKWGYIIPLLGSGVLLQVFAAEHENDFGGNSFVWHSLIVSIAFGVLLYFVTRLVRPQVENNLLIEIVFYITLLFTILFLSFGPMINRKTALENEECKTFKVLDAGDKYLTVWNTLRNTKERFKPPARFLAAAAGKKEVILCIRKGGLGYSYVALFRWR